MPNGPKSQINQNGRSASGAAFVSALGLADVSQRFGVAVFAADGTLLGTAQGDEVAVQTLGLLTLD